MATAPTAMPQLAAPTGPIIAPQQQTWSAGPQFGYPATARTPAAGASTYVQPQYLPPVANQPGAVQR